MSATSVQYINGIQVIKMFGQGARSYATFVDAVRANSSLMLRWMRTTLPWTAVTMNVWPAVFLGVLPVGTLLTVNGSLAGNTFVTIIVLSLGITGPLFTAVLFTSDLSKISTVMAEIDAVLDRPEMHRPAPEDANYSLPTSADVTLDHVSFSYESSHDTTDLALQDITLTIPAGTSLALVGPSGSGKSTIAKLIASQWDPTDGAVRIGGIDLTTLPLTESAGLVSYVAQDNFLFNDTVLENIRVGRPTATDDDVVACAKAAGCHDFIEGLERGYQTIVGGSGGHLSGGERQRVAIARALLKDAPIIVLDEATAFADPENELVIQRAIGRLAYGKTLIVVAHRLSTITEMDCIAVVDKGTILATGTHTELLESCPLYAQLWAAHRAAVEA